MTVSGPIIPRFFRRILIPAEYEGRQGTNPLWQVLCSVASDVIIQIGGECSRRSDRWQRKFELVTRPLSDVGRSVAVAQKDTGSPGPGHIGNPGPLGAPAPFKRGLRQKSATAAILPRRTIMNRHHCKRPFAEPVLAWTWVQSSWLAVAKLQHTGYYCTRQYTDSKQGSMGWRTPPKCAYSFAIVLIWIKSSRGISYLLVIAKEEFECVHWIHTDFFQLWLSGGFIINIYIYNI